MRRLCVTTLLVLGLVACGGKPVPTMSATPATSATTASSAPPETSETRGRPCTDAEIEVDDYCVKECSSNEDCAKDEICEQLRVPTEDGTMGPVMGNGCTK